MSTKTRTRWVCLVDPQAKKAVKPWLKRSRSMGDLFDRMVRFCLTQGFDPVKQPNFQEEGR